MLLCTHSDPLTRAWLKGQRLKKKSRTISHHSHVLAENGSGEKLVTKKAVGSRRAAWRIATRGEQEENTEGNKQEAAFARERAARVEVELQKICNSMLALIDETEVRKNSCCGPETRGANAAARHTRGVVGGSECDAAVHSVGLWYFVENRERERGTENSDELRGVA